MSIRPFYRSARTPREQQIEMHTDVSEMNQDDDMSMLIDGAKADTGENVVY